MYRAGTSALSHLRMCGRFIRTSPRSVIVDEFGVEHFVNVDFAPRYNIAASQPVETIINDGGSPSINSRLACPPSVLDLVFPNAEGTPRHRSTIAQEGLRPALKRAKLRQVTIHLRRHTFASALIIDGQKVVADLLGSDKVKKTR